jgi:enamine deaminase RidA (YjgF/YER057c/UK114 family)
VGYEDNVAKLGYRIEPANLETGKFVQGVKVGNLVFTSGQIPSWEGREFKGKVGKDLSLEDAQQAARLCALNNLKVIKTLAGSLNNVKRVVKVFGMVNVAPDFDNTPGVINGCSDLLREVFGEEGKHARSAVGMTIPFNFAVEVEMVVELK